MVRKVKVMLLVLTTAVALTAMTALPAQAGTCPLYRFITTGSCW